MAFPSDLAGAEIVSRLNGIRGFLVILEVVAASRATDLGRAIHAESPARQVEKVRAIVGQFTATPVPSPVPVVVNHVVSVRTFRGGSLPERVIEPVRYRCRLAVADRGAVGVVP